MTLTPGQYLVLLVKTRVLFVNTATLPAARRRHVDPRRDHAPPRPGDPRAVRRVRHRAGRRPDADVRRPAGHPRSHASSRSNLGPELSGNTLGGRIKALVATLPAVAGIVRLGWHAAPPGHPDHPHQRPPARRARLRAARQLTRTPLHRPRPRRLQPVDGPDAAVVAAPRRRPRRHLGVRRPVARRRRHPGRPGARRPQRDRRRRLGARRGRDATRAELGIAAGAPVLVTVCRLFPEKGPADIIRALPRSAPSSPTSRS